MDPVLAAFYARQRRRTATWVVLVLGCSAGAWAWPSTAPAWVATAAVGCSLLAYTMASASIALYVTRGPSHGHRGPDGH